MNPPKGTKAEAIRIFVRKYPEGTRQEFTAETGISTVASNFYLVRKATLEEMKKEQKRKMKSWSEVAAGTDPRKHRPVVLTDEQVVQKNIENDLRKELNDTKQKLDEYRYRYWKLEGDKFGYVERLLREGKVT